MFCLEPTFTVLSLFCLAQPDFREKHKQTECERARWLHIAVNSKIRTTPQERLREIVWMQRYQIFRLSDSHVIIKNCHLWFIDF